MALMALRDLRVLMALMVLRDLPVLPALTALTVLMVLRELLVPLGHRVIQDLLVHKVLQVSRVQQVTLARKATLVSREATVKSCSQESLIERLSGYSPLRMQMGVGDGWRPTPTPGLARRHTIP